MTAGLNQNENDENIDKFYNAAVIFISFYFSDINSSELLFV